MDPKEFKLYEKVIDAIEVRKELESVYYILKTKLKKETDCSPSYKKPALKNEECMELGIDKDGIVSAVLAHYKADVISIILGHSEYYEKQKTP